MHDAFKRKRSGNSTCIAFAAYTQLTSAAASAGGEEDVAIRIEDLGPDKHGVKEFICENHAVIRYDKDANPQVLTLTDTSSGEESRAGPCQSS